MDSKFSQKMKDIMAFSKEEAIRLNNNFIGTEHIFLGILREGEGLAIETLILLGLDLYDLKKSIETKIRLKGENEIPDTENVSLSGRFLSKTYEGDFKDTGKWCEDFKKFAASKNLEIKKQYMWYTTCPKCAKKYGKNYTVIIGKVGE